MFMKISYIALALASLGLLLFEAPRGALLTSSPQRGKVERKDQAVGSQATNPHTTVRRAARTAAFFYLVGGYHGGK